MRLGSQGAHVRWLQSVLNTVTLNEAPVLALDGVFGAATRSAVTLFQAQAGLRSDGIVGPKTVAALRGWDTQPEALRAEDLARAAHELRVDLPVIRGFVEVESRGNGFLPSGRCVILFERHIMRRRLLARGLPAEGPPSLVNGRPGGYLGGEREWTRMEEAQKIHRFSALESASWGLFQIMGFHANRLGYGDVERFAEAMGRGEGDHLEAFVRFVEADPVLHRALQERDYHVASRQYNGPNYAAHDYHGRFRRAVEALE